LLEVEAMVEAIVEAMVVIAAQIGPINPGSIASKCAFD
jgi:hypothetical protein